MGVKKIYLVGDVNEEMFLHFCQELDTLTPKDKAIEIILNSEGGTALDALAIASRMRALKIHYTVTVYGSCMSAAVIILAYGLERRMTQEAWVMVHEDSGKPSGDVSTLERKVAHWRRLENQWNELLAASTNITEKDWARLHKEETHLSSEECLNMGLIDEII